MEAPASRRSPVPVLPAEQELPQGNAQAGGTVAAGVLSSLMPLLSLFDAPLANKTEAAEELMEQQQEGLNKLKRMDLEQEQLQLLMQYKEKFAKLELIIWGSEMKDSYIHQMLVHTVHHSDSIAQTRESLEMLYKLHKKKHVKMYDKEQVQVWHMQIYGPLRKELKMSASSVSRFLNEQLLRKVAIHEDPHSVVGMMLDMMFVGRTKSDGKVQSINPKLWRVYECIDFEEDTNMHKVIRWVDPNFVATEKDATSTALLSCLAADQKKNGDAYENNEGTDVTNTMTAAENGECVFEPEYISLQESIFDFLDLETAATRYAEDVDSEERELVRDKEVDEVF
jgi:hypothetical protein